MKTFKQFLLEMPISVSTIDHGDIESQMLDDEDTKKPGKFERNEIVGRINNYNIHARSFKSQESNKKFPPHTYIAKHDDTNIDHMKVRGGTTKDNYFIANETKKHPESEISAPEFYHSILHTGIHKGIQSGEEHTEGGKSIWKRLHHEHPDIEVTHHNAKTGKQIKLHTGDDWDKNYDQPNETYFRAKIKEEK